ncbi:MAG: hypothetical protein HW411_1339 [Gammaproteobacteria bacterium]|nr:hypothetical protein [Gammaproteobacteria bacterium]MBM2830549.1 hypothetical protein [Gammaproteobacteria bacterium]
MTDKNLPVTLTRRTLLTRSALGRVRSLVDDDVYVFRGTDARYNNSNKIIQC